MCFSLLCERYVQSLPHRGSKQLFVPFFREIRAIRGRNFDGNIFPCAQKKRATGSLLKATRIALRHVIENNSTTHNCDHAAGGENRMWTHGRSSPRASLIISGVIPIFAQQNFCRPKRRKQPRIIRWALISTHESVIKSSAIVGSCIRATATGPSPAKMNSLSVAFSYRV